MNAITKPNTPTATAQPAEKNFKRAAIEETEIIRLELGMDHRTFSEALGYSAGVYTQWLKMNELPATGALAAKALYYEKKQKLPDAKTTTYIMRVQPNGAVDIVKLSIGDLREIAMDGQQFWLVPKPAA